VAFAAGFFVGICWGKCDYLAQIQHEKATNLLQGE